MTFTSFPRKSPFGRLKEQLLGNPEQSLKEAYEAASRIKSIENLYFSGYRVPIESLTSDRLQGEVQENLDILRNGIEVFNSNSAASGNLGSNNLEKLIFAEGILANYTIVQTQPSSIVPVPQQPGGESYPPNSIVDVSSTATPIKAKPPRRQQKRKDTVRP